MKKFNLLMYIVIAAILAACNSSGCEKINIPQHERKWISHYLENDTIHFVSDSGDVDDFFVQIASASFTQCNRFELGEYQYEKLTILLKQIIAAKSNSSAKSIYMDYYMDFRRDSTSSKNFDIFNLKPLKQFQSFDHVDVDTILSPYFNQNIRCYKFELGKNCYSSYSSNKVISFHWSNDYGLIAYTDASRGVFYRSK